MKSQTTLLREEFIKAWRGKDIYAELNKLEGDTYRDKEGRKTMRFSLGGHSYFLKLHSGVGWKEIFKNLISFRLPIISAKNEWLAVKFLNKLNIETMTLAAYGQQGINPATRRSFIITEELTQTMSLEYLGKQWKQKQPSYSTKKQLIEKLAFITGTMHRNGMNHRDFYLCHFLLTKNFSETNTFSVETPLYLIDLHRAQIRKKTPNRWLIKDLGSLFYSAYDVDLSQRDILRFIRCYSQNSLKNELTKRSDFWLKVRSRADKLFNE